MIIPRHKVCDICKEPVGVNKRYFNIKSRVLYVAYAGSDRDNKTHHICENCMAKIEEYIQNGKEKEE